MQSGRLLLLPDVGPQADSNPTQLWGTILVRQHVQTHNDQNASGSERQAHDE